MLKRDTFFQKIGLFCLATLLIIVIWGGLVPNIALSQQSDSRFNALESDINSIESRLNRLESQLNQGLRSDSRTPTNSPQPSITTGQSRLPVNRDQMFDRLATLVIELKQQVNKLENRVSKLES